MFALIFVVTSLGSLSLTSASQGAVSLPSPPTDIQFTVSSDGYESVITATLRPVNCGGNSNCTEPHGYVIKCSVPGSKISTTVWKSQLMEMDPIRVNMTGASPATQYECKVASFNCYGIGNSGSKSFVDTPEAVPRTAPTQVYSSDVQTESIRLNWHYTETPSPGVVTTFKIEIFYKDNRYPGRDGEHVHNIVYNIAEVDRSSVVFSYLLMYLDPGTEYNLLIRAVTAAGEGPAARISQQTLSTVPTIIPYDVTGSILSYVHSEPPSFFFQWMVRNQDRHLLHDIAGFMITCSANKTNGIISISEPVFSASDVSMQMELSGILYFPNTCGSSVSEEVVCSVAAFNNRGLGERSDAVPINLPCSSDSPGTLDGSFLTNPYFSLGLLSVLILLILGVGAAIATVCVCSSCSHHHRKIPMASYSSTDDNYVPMASTEAEGVRSIWSDTHTPGAYSGSVGVVMFGNGDPAYDEIPAERSADNVYDEIHPHSYRAVSVHTQQEAESGGGSDCSNGASTHLKTHNTDPQTGTRMNPLCTGLQTVSLPSSSQSGTVRDSTMTEYMELSSPLMEGGGTIDNAARYSTADSGVNLTSSDVERGLNLNHPSLHSELPQNEAVESVRFRQYPHQRSKISDSHCKDKPHSDSTENSYYNMMFPYSMPDENRTSLEQNVDTKLVDEEVEAESGVGMESQVSNTNRTCLHSTPNMEPSQTTVVISAVSKCSNVETSTRIGTDDSFGGEGEGEGEGESEGEGGADGSDRENYIEEDKVD